MSCRQGFTLDVSLLFLDKDLTFWAEAFNHVIDCLRNEAFRKNNLRYSGVVKAKGAMAMLAIEMGMLILESAFIVSTAKLVLEGSTAILYGMNEMVLEQEGKSAEDGTLVHREKTILEVLDGIRMAGTSQLTEDKQARGCGLHPMRNQTCFWIRDKLIYLIDKTVMRHRTLNN